LIAVSGFTEKRTSALGVFAVAVFAARACPVPAPILHEIGAKALPVPTNPVCAAVGFRKGLILAVGSVVNDLDGFAHIR